MRELVVLDRQLVSMECSSNAANSNSIASIVSLFFFCKRSSSDFKQRHGTPCR